MGYMERYIAGEHVAEFQAGRIAYAELIRRLTYLTLHATRRVGPGGNHGVHNRGLAHGDQRAGCDGDTVPPPAPSATVIMLTATATLLT